MPTNVLDQLFDKIYNIFHHFEILDNQKIICPVQMKHLECNRKIVDRKHSIPIKYQRTKKKSFLVEFFVIF